VSSASSQPGVESPARTFFRSDIQGLRAIAIGTVLLAHADLGPFHGGFVGVDVFFAISGFLITQLLLREIARTGTLSIPGFYARRARRILPAASLVLAATALASGLWLGQVDAPVALRDILWAAFFAANIRFAQLGTDYFAQGLPPSPVQHFWSLAVEEQFYLFWPILMLAIVLLLRRRHRARQAERHSEPAAAPIRALAVAIVVVCVASFVWSLLDTRHNPHSAYFSSLTRAWELGLGALGAIVVETVTRQRRRLAPVQTLVASVLGIALILWAVLTYDASTPFPGWQAGPPVVGSVLLLVIGGVCATPSLVQRLLSLPPLRVVGDWSYSLYLWHWPLLIVPQVYLGHDLTLAERLAMVALAFVLSAITYRYVETPFRTARPFRRVRVAASLYPATVLLVALACLGGQGAMALVADHSHHPPITLGKDWQQRFHTHDRAVALVRASVAAARRGVAIPSDLVPSLADLRNSIGDVGACDYSDQAVRTLCPRGDTSSTHTIVVLGNSHARHWIPAFDSIGATLHYRVYYLAKSQCVLSDVTPDLGDSGAPDTGCVQFRQWAVQQIARLHPDLVVLSTSPTTAGVYDANGNDVTDKTQVDQIVQAGYVALLHQLENDSERAVFLLDIPQVDRDPGTCLSTGHPSLKTCLSSSHRHSDDALRQQEAATQAGVQAIPTQQWFCYQGVCPAVVGNLIVHRDFGHMTNEYSAFLAGPLARALGITASQ
jgi:peptidoglycan/LPS O-acetylase OafA/YrhL